MQFNNLVGIGLIMALLQMSACSNDNVKLTKEVKENKRTVVKSMIQDEAMQEQNPQQLAQATVDSFEKLFGVTQGRRRNHTKGFCFIKEETVMLQMISLQNTEWVYLLIRRLVKHI